MKLLSSISFRMQISVTSVLKKNNLNFFFQFLFYTKAIDQVYKHYQQISHDIFPHTTGRHRVQRGAIGQEGIGKDPSGAGGQQDQGEDQQVHAAEAEQGEQPRTWGDVHHIVPVRRQVHGEEWGKVDR